MTIPAGAQPLAAKKDSTVGLLDRWLTAIENHTPGEEDAAVVDFAGLKPAERARLVTIAVPFAVLVRRMPELASPPGVRLSDADRGAVLVLAKRALERGSFVSWLHRAVMFETDVAILAPEVTAVAMNGASDPSLPQAVRADDGELGAKSLLNWHFRLARDLVAVRDAAGSDVFAAAWYHAVALYQLRNLLLAELTPHIAQGLQLFPDDPRMLFDSGCLSDAMSSARTQAVLVSNRSLTFHPNIPRAEAAETQAISFFKRVLALTPDYAEARVRLARLQELHGNAGEALDTLVPVFGPKPVSREAAYMAHLVAGRAAAALGRRADALEHFNASLSLFPTAQAPVVSLSTLALESGDIERATGLAGSLRERSGRNERDDPWWWYFDSPWLGAEALLDQLRQAVRR